MRPRESPEDRPDGVRSWRTERPRPCGDPPRSPGGRNSPGLARGGSRPRGKGSTESSSPLPVAMVPVTFTRTSKSPGTSRGCAGHSRDRARRQQVGDAGDEDRGPIGGPVQDDPAIAVRIDDRLQSESPSIRFASSLIPGFTGPSCEAIDIRRLHGDLRRARASPRPAAYGGRVERSQPAGSEAGRAAEPPDPERSRLRLGTRRSGTIVLAPAGETDHHRSRRSPAGRPSRRSRADVGRDEPRRVTWRPRPPATPSGVGFAASAARRRRGRRELGLLPLGQQLAFDAPDRLDHRLGRRRPVRRLLGQQSHDQRVQGRRHGGVQISRGARGGFRRRATSARP